jgi:hypothetical protein
MSAPTGVELNVVCIVLIALFWAFYGFRNIWNLPLRHGHGSFLNVEVPPGFYGGPGILWLKSYRSAVIALHLVWVSALVAIIVGGRWDMTGWWGAGWALLLAIFLLIFKAWTRHTLGANPPVLPGVAAPLEVRQLGDYISWPMEALAASIIAFSWWGLLRHGGTHVDWQLPATVTWIALGMLPGKIILVRNSFPLPPECTEEHHRLSEASRRYSLRVMDAMSWIFVVTLAVYAVKQGWISTQEVPGLSWIFVAIQLAPCFVLVALLVRGGTRLAAMGRGLRPAGSWSTPFGPARRMLPGYLAWFGIWFGGILVSVLHSFK